MYWSNDDKRQDKLILVLSQGTMNEYRTTVLIFWKLNVKVWLYLY